MGKHAQNNSLGKALLKSRFSRANANVDGNDRWLHTSDLNDGADWNRINLTSVTEQNSLDEFLSTAELAGTQFESERLNVNFVNPIASIGILKNEDVAMLKEMHNKHQDLLRIPRRPFWKTKEYDAQTLQLKEREAFLEWRRNLAKYQDVEHLKMTPFEKNLEFWRQLWRVIERSDVIIQIVDARNPLLFYCQDLVQYVKELDENKMSLILVNKSDFLSERQRLEWLRYFESKNIKVIFWSAALASEANGFKLEQDESESDYDDSHSSKLNDDDNEDDLENLNEVDEDDVQDQKEMSSENVNKFNILSDERTEDDDSKSDSDRTATDHEEEEEEDQSDEEGDNTEEEEADKKSGKVIKSNKPDNNNNHNNEKSSSESIKKQLLEEIEAKLKEMNITDEEREKCKIVTREELIHLFKTVHKSVDKVKPGTNTIGLVGYPNVGKSSTLNAILQNKKVAVSETPGKTKHYQTIHIDDDLILCDCPGLVFPSFVSTRGELIINGILPIDQMRDYVEPVNQVIHHIPKRVLEMIYGIKMPNPKEGEDPNRSPTAEELCSTYSIFRGYMNHKGTPDVNRGARYILKDYVNGKLVYCYPPPVVQDAKSFQEHHYYEEKELKYEEKMKKLEQQALLNVKGPQLTNFDKTFFLNLQPKALTKGGIVSYYKCKRSMPIGSAMNEPSSADPNQIDLTGMGKPWKKHFNSGKREKLRRKTAHFDN